MTTRNKPKLVTAAKDYRCLVCDKEIPKGTQHVTITYLSPYLKESFAELTKFHVYIKVFEAFLSLRFCTGTCFRKFARFQMDDFKSEDSQIALKRLRKIEKEARERRLEGWKNWKVWKEVFEPLDRKYRICEIDE